MPRHAAAALPRQGRAWQAAHQLQPVCTCISTGCATKCTGCVTKHSVSGALGGCVAGQRASRRRTGPGRRSGVEESRGSDERGETGLSKTRCTMASRAGLCTSARRQRRPRVRPAVSRTCRGAGQRRARRACMLGRSTNQNCAGIGEPWHVASDGGWPPCCAATLLPGPRSLEGARPRCMRAPELCPCTVSCKRPGLPGLQLFLRAALTWQRPRTAARVNLRGREQPTDVVMCMCARCGRESDA